MNLLFNLRNTALTAKINIVKPSDIHGRQISLSVLSKDITTHGVIEKLRL